jgi:hypothetical protein
MTANSPASPEGSILTPNGWVTGKVAFACLVKLDEDLRLQGVWVDGESIAPGFLAPPFIV